VWPNAANNAAKGAWHHCLRALGRNHSTKHKGSVIRGSCTHRWECQPVFALLAYHTGAPCGVQLTMCSAPQASNCSPCQAFARCRARATRTDRAAVAAPHPHSKTQVANQLQLSSVVHKVRVAFWQVPFFAFAAGRPTSIPSVCSSTRLKDLTTVEFRLHRSRCSCSCAQAAHDGAQASKMY